MFAIVLLSSCPPSMRRALTLLGCVFRFVLRAAFDTRYKNNAKDFALFSLLLLRCSLLRSLQRVLGCGTSEATTLARRSLGLGDEHETITRTGNGSFDQQEVVVEIDAANAQVANRDLSVAHVTGHALTR